MRGGVIVMKGGGDIVMVEAIVMVEVIVMEVRLL